MRFKSSVFLLKLTDFLQEKYSKHIFEPDTYLNLIEIITLESAKKGLKDVENVLMISDDNNVSLAYKEENETILNIKKQANEFMKASE